MSALERHRSDCDALIDLEEDADGFQRSVLYRACYTGLHCSPHASDKLRQECLEREFEALSLPAAPWERTNVVTRLSSLTPTLREVVARVARRGGSRAALLVRALGPLFPTNVEVNPAADLIVEAVVEALRSQRAEPACSELFDQLRDQPRAGENEEGESEPALRRELLSDGGSGGCLSKLIAPADFAEVRAALDSHEFLTVAASPHDELKIIPSAPREFVRLVPEDHTFVVKGRRLFLAAVPRRSTVTLILNRSAESKVAPMVWSKVMSSPVQLVAPEVTCARIELALERKTSTRPPLLLLDSWPLVLRESGDQTDQVSRWSAEVMTRPKLQRLTILYEYEGRREIEYQTLETRRVETPDGCSTRRLDLTPRKVVALVPVAVSPLCVDAGIDRTVFRNLARAELKPVAERAGREWRDYETWKHTLTWVTDLRALRPAARGRDEEVPPSPAESFERFSGYVDELLRQGVREAVQVELYCNRTQRSDLQFSVWTTKIDIDQANRRREDLIAGRLLAGILREEGVTTRQQAGLSETMSDAFMRLFDVAHLTRDQQPRGITFGQQVIVHPGFYVPQAENHDAPMDWHLVLEAKRLQEDESRLCAYADSEFERRWATLGGAPAIATVHVEPARVASAADLLFQPAEPGLYGLKLALRQVQSGEGPMEVAVARDSSAFGRLAGAWATLFGSGSSSSEKKQEGLREADHYFQCVRVEKPSAQFWGAMTLGNGFGDRLGMRGGVDFGVRLSLSDQTAWGVGVGYAGRAFYATSASSWDDLLQRGARPPPGFGGRGELEYTWVRHGLLVSIFSEFSLFGTGPIFIRPSAIADFGLVDTREVPEALQSFLQSKEPGDPIFDFDVGLRLDIELSLLWGLALNSGLEVSGLDDVVIGWWGRPINKARATFDNALVWNVGMRWTP